MGSMGPNIVGMFSEPNIIFDGTDKAVQIELANKFIDLARYLDKTLPDGRQKSIAFTELENASMRAHKSLAGVGY
jgi:hypothetical protein